MRGSVNGYATKVRRDVQALQADGVSAWKRDRVDPGAPSAFDSAVSQANADIAPVNAD
jgi:hypothetical protein